MKQGILFLMSLQLLSFISCNGDEFADDNPVIIDIPYDIVGNLDTMEEAICRDSLPYFRSSGAEYTFDIEDKVYINLVHNSSIRNEWVFTKTKVNDVHRGQVDAEEKIYYYNSSTKECVLLDSIKAGFESISIEGNYVAYSTHSSQTFIYNLSTKERRNITGRSVSLSTNGSILKLYNFNSENEILFYSTRELTELFSGSYGNGGPVAPIWMNDEEFVNFAVTWDGTTFQFQGTRWNVLKKSVDTLFILDNNRGYGLPRIWIDSTNSAMMGWGTLFDIKNLEANEYYERCDNKFFNSFINIGKGSEFLGHRYYYYVDEENKRVVFSTKYVLLDIKNGTKQEIKFHFDNDEF